MAVQPEQGEDTIDLLELFMGLLAHWTLIAATAVVGAVLMALYTFFLVTPMYKATATIYVVSRNDSVLNFSDLQVGSELTSDYIKVFEMWEVHEKVISNLDLDYTYTDMASMLSVTNTSDTRMLDITVTNPDPEEAAAIANEYADVGAKYISEKMKTDEPTLMSSARVPENPFSPNKSKNILLGFVVGFVLDFVLRGVLPKGLRGGYTGHADEVDCHEEHNDAEGNEKPIWQAALRHTLEIFVFIFAFSLVFGMIVEGVGEDVFAEVLGGMGFFQPVVAALVGLIPNCAASVLLTQLYVEGALRFSSLVAGLCTGAGVGLAVLWRTNPSWKQNLFITGLTWGAGAFLGVAMQVVVAVFA